MARDSFDHFIIDNRIVLQVNAFPVHDDKLIRSCRFVWRSLKVGYYQRAEELFIRCAASMWSMIIIIRVALNGKEATPPAAR